MLRIQKAAVLGAGTMGAQIAAHLANAGIPCLLLDIPPSSLSPEEEKAGLGLKDPLVRNRLTQTLWERACRLSPSPLYLAERSDLVQIGNVEDHLGLLKDVDWVVEAVLERIDLKQEIHGKIARHVRPGTLVSTNTSGIPMQTILQGIPSSHHSSFIGTHFFNPPRYMRLLEVIPTPSTSPDLLREFCEFGERVLGKGIVVCKDTPGFIGNRVGCFDMQHAYWLTLEEGLTVEEVDAITGPLMGRPRSATFRLTDLVGLDIMAHIGKNMLEALPGDDRRKFFEHPPYVKVMLERGWLGEKKKQGFYRRVETAGAREIQSLNLQSLEYEPPARAALASLDGLRKISNTGDRIRSLCALDDRAGRYAWKQLRTTLCYAADRLEEIAENVVDVDRAMRWGFNWELGPFEIWDALGVRDAAHRLEKDGVAVPAIVQKLLSQNKGGFYESRQGQRWYFDFHRMDHEMEKASVFALDLKKIRQAEGVRKENPSASVLDLGDGVGCVEFHGRMNVVNPDILQLTLECLEGGRPEFSAWVIGNQAEHFSAGADLKKFLDCIERKAWKEIDEYLHLLQRVTCGIRKSKFPVVVACHGYALGGGCEVTLGADHVVASAETWMGLPEIGVGLIPGGAGCKEMMALFAERSPDQKPGSILPFVEQAWELVFQGRISKSGHEAQKWGYLSGKNRKVEIVLNRDWLLGCGKKMAMELAAHGKGAGSDRGQLPALGDAGMEGIGGRLEKMVQAREITEHDRSIGEHLAEVMCGGKGGFRWWSEQQFIDFERERFLSLCGMEKTAERIRHMLKNGKPLRN